MPRDGSDKNLIDLSTTANGVTEAITASTRQTLVKRFRLTVTKGPDEGATFASTGGAVSLGSHPAADFPLSDRAMSRFHCEIRLEEGVPLIRDLGSRNGTYLDHLAIHVAPLKPGAAISLGRSTLRFELTGDSIAVPISDRRSFGLAIGGSVAMRRVFAALESVAHNDAPVLLQGETGTGKGVVAESIHLESNRASGPFVVVDCGALPANLIESELFGHVRGAFTGADGDHVGAFERANGGTIFLDEIAELELRLQPRLLGVLERKEIQPVGSSERRALDVRLISATNRNLRKAVNTKDFRSDLYYRLAVFEVRLPALRERLDDIPILVSGMLRDTLNSAEQLRWLEEPDFLTRLQRQHWPGNVRELRNTIERARLLGEPSPMPHTDTDSVPPPIDPSVPLRTARQKWVHYFERRYLSSLLAAHDNNVTAAARACGVDRMHLYRLLRRAGLR